MDDNNDNNNKECDASTSNSTTNNITEDQPKHKAEELNHDNVEPNK
jgi:hypothetical protein